MCRMGKGCTSSMPCDICRSWTVETWQRVRWADLRSAKRRLSRAETWFNVGDSRARTIDTSISKIKDHNCTSLGIEAVLAGEARLHGGARPSAGMLTGGVM